MLVPSPPQVQKGVEKAEDSSGGIHTVRCVDYVSTCLLNRSGNRWTISATCYKHLNQQLWHTHWHIQKKPGAVESSIVQALQCFMVLQQRA